MNVIHVIFNPCSSLDLLQKICDEKQVYGYELIRVVPYHTFEAVAVFKCDLAEPGEKIVAR